MGNNNSQQPPPSSVDVVRRPPSRPNAPPSSRPISDLGPHGPTYNQPENQVLPREIPILKLRSVSMELSKSNPNYQNIYAYENLENYKHNENDNNNEINDGEEKRGDTPEKENTTSPPRPPPPPVANGHISGLGNVSPSVTPTAQVFPVSQIPNGHAVKDVKNVTNNVKSASSSVPYRPSHRRQMSLTTNLTGQEHTIIEEPEENIDKRVKLDPLMQSYPGATGPSLPVKNNFNLDYSYQLTYVQLAEHRRNKTIEDLEKRTGKRLSDLSADLNNHTEQQAFIRDAPSRVSTRSTGSAGTALSSKKKRAPTPPGQAPPPPPSTAPNSQPTSPRTPQSPRSAAYTPDNEPPIDYDMDSPRRNFMLPRYTVNPPVSRIPPTATNVPPPPPAPQNGANSPRKQVNVSRSNSMSNGTPEIILKRTPSTKQAHKASETPEGQVPWLLEIKNLSESRAARRQLSLETSETPIAPTNDDMKQTEQTENADEPKIEEPKAKESAKTKLVFESSKIEFMPEAPALARKDVQPKSATLERMNSFKSLKEPASPKLQRTHSTTVFDRPSPSKFQSQTSIPSAQNSADPMRRLSSLLQHDIKATASAKCLKLVKQTTPVLPRPKDPHTVFREQLQKACSQRDDRVQSEGTIDEKLKRSTSVENELEKDTISDVKERKELEVESKETKANEPPQVLPKPPRYHKNVTLNRNMSAYTKSRQMVPDTNGDETKNTNDKYRISASFDWTPEDDLDSDDNLSDREAMTSRKGSSDGFKSTIVPSNVNDLKAKRKGKAKEKKQRVSESSEDLNPKNKFGSVKKFKKSMHKSVKNAFGSISKASGKLLRKQRTEDLEVIEDAPKNWHLTSNGPNVVVNGHHDRSSDYPLPNGFHDDDSESESEKYFENENEFSEVIFRQHNGITSEEETSNDEEDDSVGKAPQNIKRAGVAYYNTDGKLVVLPDEQMHPGSKTDSMKARDKRKKYPSFEGTGTGKKREKEAATERANEAIRENERRIEEEKRKQLEIELEMHKIREAETRERLQRLESAHLQQQQISAQLFQQQHQQQNLSMLNVPPVPSTGALMPNYSSMYETATTPTFTNLFGQQLPQNGYQSNFGLYNPQTGPMMNGSIPYDLNDYMRTLGLQAPPTSQQMAFFLNNMTLNAGQPFDRKSNPSLFQVINQDPLKQFPNGTLNYQMNDPTLRKQGFQNWASSPNISSTVPANSNSVPLGDFVTSYNNYNGANTNNNKDDKKNAKARNPLYNSDSDEGLSPQKSVARVQVQDFRQLPVRTESGKFMRRYGGDSHVSQNKQSQNSDDTRETRSTKNVSHNGIIPQRQGSVSPSNSTSTVDSAITSSSVTLSPPPSPGKFNGAPASPMVAAKSRQTGYRTVLDMTSADIKTQILTYDESQADH